MGEGKVKEELFDALPEIAPRRKGANHKGRHGRLETDLHLWNRRYF